MGFPGGSVVKNPPANAGHASSIPGSGRSPGSRHGKKMKEKFLPPNKKVPIIFRPLAL